MDSVDGAFPEGDHFRREGHSSSGDVFYLRRDPRNKNLARTTSSLLTPNLKFDENWVGEKPRLIVLLENIPEFATEKYIREWIEETSSMMVEQVVLQRHMATMKNLGRAVVRFSSSLSAQSVACKLDKKKCLGNLISVRLLNEEEYNQLDCAPSSTMKLETKPVEPQNGYISLSEKKPKATETMEIGPIRVQTDSSKIQEKHSQNYYVLFECDRHFYTDDVFEFFKLYEPIRAFRVLSECCLQYSSLDQCEKVKSRYDGEYFMGKKLRLRLHTTQNDIRDDIKASRSSSVSSSTKVNQSTNRHEEEKSKISRKTEDVRLLKESTTLQRRVKNKAFALLLQQLSEVTVRDLRRRLLSHSLEVFLERLETKQKPSSEISSNYFETMVSKEPHEAHMNALPSFKKKAGTETGGHRPTRQMHISKAGDSIEHHQLRTQSVKNLTRTTSRTLNVDSDSSQEQDYSVTEDEIDWSDQDEFLEDDELEPVQKEKKIPKDRKRPRKDDASKDLYPKVPVHDVDLSSEMVTLEEAPIKKRRRDLSQKSEMTYLTSDGLDVSVKQPRGTLIWRKRRSRPLTIFDVDLDYLKGELNDEDRALTEQLERQYETDAQEAMLADTVKVYGTYGILIQPHRSGSARTEGFYKIPLSHKPRYVPSYHFTPSIMEMLDTDKDSKEKTPWHRSRLEPGLDLNALPDIVRYSLLQLHKTRLQFGKSSIHEWGLFALEDIESNDIVIEYVGEVIGQKVADRREKHYEAIGIGSSYLFRVNEDMIVDATTKGNLARFVNHCCEPNCEARILDVNDSKRIVFYSKRLIKRGEELTFDYKFPIEDEKIPCFCGAANCRGSLN